MKSLVESIFDDDQTYINKSFDNDPYTFKNRKDGIKEWLKLNKLLPTKLQIDELGLYCNLYSVLKYKLDFKHDQEGDDVLIVYTNGKYVHNPTNLKLIQFYGPNKYNNIFTITIQWPNHKLSDHLIKYFDKLKTTLLGCGYELGFDGPHPYDWGLHRQIFRKTIQP